MMPEFKAHDCIFTAYGRYTIYRVSHSKGKVYARGTGISDSKMAFLMDDLQWWGWAWVCPAYGVNK